MVKFDKYLKIDVLMEARDIVNKSLWMDKCIVEKILTVSR